MMEHQRMGYEFQGLRELCGVQQGWRAKSAGVEVLSEGKEEGDSQCGRAGVGHSAYSAEALYLERGELYLWPALVCLLCTLPVVFFALYRWSATCVAVASLYAFRATLHAFLVCSLALFLAINNTMFPLHPWECWRSLGHFPCAGFGRFMSSLLQTLPVVSCFAGALGTYFCPLSAVLCLLSWLKSFFFLSFTINAGFF